MLHFGQISVPHKIMILSVINDGYKISCIEHPPSMFFCYNHSAINDAEFVTESILELLFYPPYISNPLSVITQTSKKKRLILDLSKVNKYVRKSHFKIDYWKIGLQYISQDANLISFNLKSGYHHIDIASEFQRYLGFSWHINDTQRYFKFNVLPFGLSTAPRSFTKTLKPLVKHWRSCGILIALYLNDGLVVIPCSKQPPKLNFQLATEIFSHIRTDLISAGFVYNSSKSIWDPTK